MQYFPKQRPVLLPWNLKLRHSLPLKEQCFNLDWTLLDTNHFYLTGSIIWHQSYWTMNKRINLGLTILSWKLWAKTWIKVMKIFTKTASEWYRASTGSPQFIDKIKKIEKEMRFSGWEIIQLNCLVCTL